MAKKLKVVVKLNVNAGKANPAPPIGPALAQHGINLMAFCKEYNARTSSMVGQVIPAEISIFTDNSFTFVLKTPPTPDLLRKAGLAVRTELPGVGENLQDHLETYVQYACKEPITLYSAINPLAKLKIGMEWMLKGTGLGATNHFESGGFIRSEAGVRHPDLQYHFLPMAVRYDGNAPATGHGYQAHVGPMRATSRGHVRIRSADAKAAPEILFNYLSTEQDRKVIVARMAELIAVFEAGEDWRPADHRFHAAIHDATGNPLFGQLIWQIHHAFHDIYDTPFGKAHLGATTIPLHKPLAEAISAGDEHRAAELTGQILDIVEVEVRQEMEGGDA